MVGFAERMGHRTARTVVQSADLDDETRVGLWNVLVGLSDDLDTAGYQSGYEDETESRVLAAVWSTELHRSLDEIGRPAATWETIKRRVLQAEWFDVLDTVEAIVRYLAQFESHTTRGLWLHVVNAFNASFERFMVGYRFIGMEITPVHSAIEAEALVIAQHVTQPLAGARHALDRAIDLLADRQNPDYPNSVKESISAVEAVVRAITGESTLGGGLGRLEASGLTIHPALKGAWSKMYGYTSDGAGIRHGGLEAAQVDQALAKYMLVTCSAFVSYLLEQGRGTDLV